MQAECNCIDVDQTYSRLTKYIRNLCLEIHELPLEEIGRIEQIYYLVL